MPNNPTTARRWIPVTPPAATRAPVRRFVRVVPLPSTCTCTVSTRRGFDHTHLTAV